MTDPIRLVLVDDHRMFRSGVKAELDASMEIVGEAPDVDSAVEVVTTDPRRTSCCWTSTCPAATATAAAT